MDGGMIMLEATVDSARLKGALDLMRKNVVKSTMPVLAMVRIEVKRRVLTLTHTNLDVHIQTTMDAEDEGTPWSCCVPAALLYDRIEKTGKTTLRLQKAKWALEVRSSGAVIVLPCLAAEEYPDCPFFGGDYWDIPSTSMLEILKRVPHAASEDETRYNLCGVHLERVGEGALVVTATDGHRLARVTYDDGFERMPLTPKDGYILPAGGMDLVHWLLHRAKGMTTMGWRPPATGASSNTVAFRVGFYEIAMRVVDGIFPNMKTVLPKHEPIKVEVDREDLLAALQPHIHRGRLNNPDWITKGAFKKGSALELEHFGPGGDVVRNEVEARVEGTRAPLEFGVNAAYLKEALKRFETERVVIGYTDASSPMTFTSPDEDGHIQVTMLMRLETYGAAPKDEDKKGKKKKG
jgi:DNA polymerase-3 subunit beta